MSRPAQLPSRRRFLSILAGGAATVAGLAAIRAFPTGSGDAPVTWRGVAFGADAEIVIGGDRARAEAGLQAALGTVRRMEALFSLYDPASDIARLNRAGRLAMQPNFARLVDDVDRAHRLTDGLFDPSVQPVFARLAAAGSLGNARDRAELAARIGWDKVIRDGDQLSFGEPGMALTFNGIAQGFATDRVIDAIAAAGIEGAVANLGEWRSLGGIAELTIASPKGERLGEVVLRDGAVATSSAFGTTVGRDHRSHILSPDLDAAAPVYATVSVEARTASMADALSTALVLARTDDLARDLRARGEARRIWLQRRDDTVTVL